MRFVAAPIAICLACVCASPPSAHSARAAAGAVYAVGYTSSASLLLAVGGRGDVLRRIPALRVAEVRSRSAGFARHARATGGIRYVEATRARASSVEPALALQPGFATPYEWQFAAAHEDAVPTSVLRAAANVTIAVIDTGADLQAPDLAAKAPRAYNLRTGTADVRDTNGHGTFVSSLAAGSVDNGIGIAGFGGDARLLVIKASSPDGTLTDLDEANAIVYAVDHGARVINLSVGGDETSETERRGIDYAARHGVLVVAAVGNEFSDGNPVEYPAALLQPVGSDGKGGIGLSVGASTNTGSRAYFSNTGSQLSLLAPGQDVFGAVSSLATDGSYPRVALPGPGLYGFGSGTSFATPEVAGVAALVMAANPFLRATDVATVIKESASGHGSWNPETGYGVVDAAAAVADAQGRPALQLKGTRTGRRVRLTWASSSLGPFRVTMTIDGASRHVLLGATRRTSTFVAIRRRHTYLFTVSLLGGDGTVTVSSTATIRT